MLDILFLGAGNGSGCEAKLTISSEASAPGSKKCITQI